MWVIGGDGALVILASRMFQVILQNRPNVKDSDA